MRRLGRTPIIVKPEGTHNYLVLIFVVDVLVVLENFKNNGLDFGKCTNDSAHVGYYDCVHEAFEFREA